MSLTTGQSDFFNATRYWRFLGCAFFLLGIANLMPVSFAQDSMAPVQLLVGKKAEESLQRMRSVTLQAVPLAAVIADLQQNLQFAIILDHRIDPDQPVTLATGLVNSRVLLRQVALSVNCEVAITDRFAVVGPPESVTRLRTVMELRRSEVRALRTKMESQTYKRWFDDAGAGWPDLMRPTRFIAEQVQSAGMTFQLSAQLPHDLWRSQQLPPLDLIQRLTVVLNQFDRSFRVNIKGEIEIVPVEQSPTIRRTIKVPTDRREAVEAFLQAQDRPVDASWSRGRTSLRGTIEFLEEVEGVIRNDKTSNVQSDLKTQRFTMSIPAGSTISRVINSLRANGVLIQIQGLNQQQRDEYLQTKVQLNAEGMLGTEFFPALLQVNGGTVQVEAASVLIQF